MEDKEDDSGSWMIGLGVVVAGLIIIVSVGATSAGYYGELRVNVSEVSPSDPDLRTRGLLGSHQRDRSSADLLGLHLL